MHLRKYKFCWSTQTFIPFSIHTAYKCPFLQTFTELLGAIQDERYLSGDLHRRLALRSSVGAGFEAYHHAHRVSRHPRLPCKCVQKPLRQFCIACSTNPEFNNIIGTISYYVSYFYQTTLSKSGWDTSLAYGTKLVEVYAAYYMQHCLQPCTYCICSES